MKYTIFTILYIMAFMLMFKEAACWCIPSLEDKHIALVHNILLIILALFIWEFIFSKTLDYLNTTKWKETLPEELKDIYDEKKYAKSMKYEKVTHKFWSITWIISFVIMLALLVFWWFGWLDNLVKSWSENNLVQSLYFFWLIFLVQSFIWVL